VDIEVNMLPKGDVDGLKWAPGYSVAEGGHGWPESRPPLFPRGGRCLRRPICTQDRLCVAKSNILHEVNLFAQNTADLKV
jgi:hypothetical protein